MTSLALLQRNLDMVRQHLRRVTWLEGLSLFAAVFLGVGLLLLAADNLFWLPRWMRLGLLILAIPATGWGIYSWLVAPLKKRWPEEAVARLVEERLSLGNTLINALQIASRKIPGSPSVQEQIVRDGAAASEQADLAKVVEFRRLKKQAMICGALCLITLGYATVFGEHFRNALARFLKPTVFVAPMTKTRILSVTGNAVALRGEDLSIRVQFDGETPYAGRLETQIGDRVQELPLEFDGQRFQGLVTGCYEDFSYRVFLGDAESDRFQVRVVEKPAIKKMEATLTFPEYTGLPQVTLTGLPPQMQYLENARMELKGELNLPVSSATLLPFRIDHAASPAATEGEALAPEKPETITWLESEVLPLSPDRTTFPKSLLFDQEQHFKIVLMGAEGFNNDEATTFALIPQPDLPPRIEELRVKGEQRLGPDQSFRLPIEASDDVGIAKIEVKAKKNGANETQTLVSYPYQKIVQGATKKRAREVAIFTPSEFGAKPGETYECWVEVSDFFPAGHCTQSGKVILTILTKEDAEKEKTQETKDFLADLNGLLQKQEATQAGTELLKTKLGKTASGLEPAAAKILQIQKEIQVKALTVVEAHKDNQAYAEARQGLAALASGELFEALTKAEAFQKSMALDEGKALTDTQAAIVAKLKALLDRIQNKDKDKDKSVQEKGLDIDHPPGSREWRRDEKDKMKAFVEQQKKILKMSEELKQKGVDNWDDEDKKLAADLAKQESDWAKFFREAWTDLSKVPEQDFSDGKLLAEVNQIAIETKLAAESITNKNMEVAVPQEASGLELAKTLETNIEKWLPDTPDNKKWSMEEPEHDTDMPMCDLPAQLEDMIGDLIEQQEDLTEDVEDVSSSWMDNADKAAGWDAMDGPISNMSAKGVTGNQMPNDSEIGGRSGEGRSGKASGQFVEESAQGKGGRQTPTRLTNDPYEKGVVKDVSKDPVGGSTGGGKMGGLDQEGLQGHPPPEVQQKLDRLKGKQAELRQQAEKLDHTLRRYNLPTGELEKTMGLMNKIEQSLSEGNYQGIQAARAALQTQVKKIKGSLDEEVRLNKEESALPKELREEIENALREKDPAGFKDLNDAYFKNLAKETGGE